MRSPFRSLIAIAAIACLAVASVAHDVCTFAAYSYRAARDFVSGAIEAFARPVVGVVGGELPAEKHQACAYALRIAKRERPTLSPTWRMCPSI